MPLNDLFLNLKGGTGSGNFGHGGRPGKRGGSSGGVGGSMGFEPIKGLDGAYTKNYGKTLVSVFQEDGKDTYKAGFSTRGGSYALVSARDKGGLEKSEAFEYVDKTGKELQKIYG